MMTSHNKKLLRDLRKDMEKWINVFGELQIYEAESLCNYNVKLKGTRRYKNKEITSLELNCAACSLFEAVESIDIVLALRDTDD